MSYGKIDVEDALFGTVFAAGALESTNLFTLSFVPTGTALDASVWEAGGVAITFAFVLTVGALAGAYLTNRVGSNRGMSVESDLNKIVWLKANVETYVVLATLLVVVALGVDLLGFRGIVQGNMYIGAAVAMIEGAGYYVVSYLG